MKTFAFRLFFVFLTLLFTLLSCNKDEDKNKFRIVSEEYSENGDSYGEANYEYVDNNISRLYAEDNEDDFFTEAVFDYSEENKIYISVTEEEDGEEDEYEMEITLSDGKIAEVLDDDGWKEEYTYNSSDQLTKVKEYEDYGDGWTLYRTTTFTYDGNKLEESLREYEDESRYKSEYMYDGDGFLEEEVSYYYNGGEWIEDYKDVYSYTAGRVTEIEYYYFFEGDWEKEDWRDEFVYDENGNLIEYIEIDDYYDDEWTTKYVYEQGSGNYRQIFGSYSFAGRDFISYPMPTKSTRRDADVTELKNTTGFYRSLKSNHGMTGMQGMHKNRISTMHGK